jgi:hypothetical protein
VVVIVMFSHNIFDVDAYLSGLPSCGLTRDSRTGSPVVPTHRNNKGGYMRLFDLRRRWRPGDDSFNTWTKSSLSMYDGNCVEVAGLAEDTILVRDSKHPRGAVLGFTRAEWDAFIGGVHNGEFDRKSPNQQP